ncbi:SulP family inorganic anion transporter [Neomegalonema sp.]|uniref:SulP family inorganic anion transporter n=1 Tax=Neomegalonema sp. TaxID=2039713 RepID=UPI002627EF99|nr:SulP family inorganic anion transporter [Neomegalonema sp.]MDD2869712.1 SulP family inorganic anion transporter [Neomegalonema sp.]
MHGSSGASAPARAHPRAEFTPQLVTSLREGYGSGDLRADALSGLTVAIVALPLSMALAIASGLPPENGLYAAVVGGFLISALGGSRYQIGGPAGAFIPLVATCVAEHGVDGLLLATGMAGVFLAIMGALRWGSYVKFVPYPVTVGFTAGIAVVIFATQIKELLGLTLEGPEPAHFLPKLGVLYEALPTVSFGAVMISAATIGMILAVRRWRPGWPAFLIGVVGATLLAQVSPFEVATIGSRFGELSGGLPAPRLPEISFAAMRDVLPEALTFTLLGAIESLLSATVADAMTGRRHRSNMELAAQGAANMAAAIFGAMPVTGTIARTAANVRSGARTPVSGMLHAAFLLAMLVLAASWLAHAPLAALGGVLAVVAWNMAEKHEFAALARSSGADATVLLTTFFTTVVFDLTWGILVGFSLSALLFLNRMADSAQVESRPLEEAAGYDAAARSHPDLVVHRITGAFFFGSAQSVGTVLDRVGDPRRAVIYDVSALREVDSSAAHTLVEAALKAHRRGKRVLVAGASAATQRALMRGGLSSTVASYAPSVEAAAHLARSERTEEAAPAPDENLG